MISEFCFTPATTLAKLIRDRSVSPVDVVQALLDRIEAVNPIINAYVTVTADAALASARQAEQGVVDGDALGSLHGVPFAVKDLLYTANIRTTAGSRAFAEFIPSDNAIVVERLLKAGAILLGKTNTPEFGFKSTTENALFGATNNPWDVTRTAGGSSGGAGAATAAGMASLSVGTDAGGSIRTPASFCGIVGFKPSFGRVPNGPGFGGGATLAHAGPMTRTVADAALMLDVMAGVDERDRRSVPTDCERFSARIDDHNASLRIGWSLDLGYAAVDPLVERAFMASVARFGEMGWNVAPAAIAFDDPQSLFNTIIRAENYVFAADIVARHGPLIDPGMRTFTENGADVTAYEYLCANRERERLCLRLAELFSDHDLLVTPTLAVAPFVHGQRPREIAGRAVAGMSWLSFTYPFNLTGNPALSVPCGWTESGLPLGIQIIGPRFSDALVLQAGAALEAIQPWADRQPLLDG